MTYSSAKWAWVAERAQREVGRGASVVRASVGRWGEAGLLQLDDSALQARTFAEARTVPGWEAARLVTGRVTRWGGGLPQYLPTTAGWSTGCGTTSTGIPGWRSPAPRSTGSGSPPVSSSAAAAANKIIAGLKPVGME